MNIGIYRIRNVVNNKSYYGSSKNINKRWGRHRLDLNNNRHHNSILQRAWNKYGESNFMFEVVELCDVDLLLINEQKYLDMLPEYNIGLISSGGDNITNNPNKIKICENISIGMKQYISTLTKEEINNKLSMPGNKNPNWRGGSSIVLCGCGNKMAYNSKTCGKCRDRSGDKNPFFNKHHTKDTIDKMAENKLGKYNGNQNIPVLIDDVEYSSLGEASKILNIHLTTIRYRILSKNSKFNNYKYV